MNAADSLYEEIRDMLADGLGVEPEDVAPSARFFDDLGGESIDVLDLSFRCEQKYGVPVRFQQLFDPGEWNAAPDGSVPPERLRRLRERFPFLEGVPLETAASPGDMKSLFTVELIVATVRHAVSAGTADKSSTIRR